MDGRELAQDFAKVVAIELSADKSRKQVERCDIRPGYLSRDYYFVQPPFLAKLGQEWGYRRYHMEYEKRLGRHG
jgi:hypothetical protein